MRPRKGILEQFSTFLQFDADRVQGWIVDPRLRRNMDSRLAQAPQSESSQPESSEHFWVLYWHRIWQAETHRLAQGHLAAYLQEVCYWAAQKVMTRFANTQFQLSDCFQVAIVRLDKVLQGFNSNQSLSLKSYASVTFSSVIKDTLRQRQIIDICTPWAMLHKLSKRRLVDSLHHAGLTSEAIDRSVLAWTCFNTLYAPSEVSTRTASTRKLLKPKQETWEAIAQLYNSQRQTQFSFSEPQRKPEEIEAWLTACANAARQYLYPNLVSINAPLSGQEDGELLDILPQPDAETAMGGLMAEEDTDRANQLSAALTEAVQQLDPEAKQLLQLYYVQGLTQQQIAQQLNVKQYTVSRQLSRMKRSLQRSLVEWSQKTLHITPNLSVLESMSTALEEWLQLRYRQE